MTQPMQTTRKRGVHQLLALVIGIVYLLVGIAGFFVTGFDGFVEHDHDQTLLGFAINPLHNIVHLLIGILGVTMWATSAGARTFGWLLLIGYGAAFVYGLIALDRPEINFLNINMADNWLHVFSALAGLAIAIWPARRSSVNRAAPQHGTVPPQAPAPQQGAVPPQAPAPQQGAVPPQAPAPQQEPDPRGYDPRGRDPQL